MRVTRIIILVLSFISIIVINCACNDIRLVELNLDNYQKEFIECEIPIVIYAWAEWCKPCKLLSPVIERLAIFYEKKVKFIKVNVDDNRKLLENFRPFRGLPVLIFYKNGKEVDRIIGFVPFLIINDKIRIILKEEKMSDKKDKDDCDDEVCDPQL